VLFGRPTAAASGKKFEPQWTDAHYAAVRHSGAGYEPCQWASVIVRINDRGPSVSGRIVDVSRSAAATLVMAEHGIAKVKLEFVQQPPLPISRSLASDREWQKVDVGALQVGC
jgi:rare lipoprotein A